MAKSRETLLDELNASVRSAGQGGLTTAQNLRDFLTTLIDEVVDRSGAGEKPAPEAYLFQVESAAGEVGPCLGLTTIQARYLAENYGATIDLLFPSPDTGEKVPVTINYDLATGQFRSKGPNPEADDQPRVYLVGHGPLAAAASPRQVRLELAFEPGTEAGQTYQVTATQAGTYSRYESRNVEAADFLLNEKHVTLPLKLAPGDKLRVTITRTDPELYAVVVLPG